jgi:uncharacterized protein (DUF433 family)
MKLHGININDYFDFLDDDDIRIKGTRVGIETVLDDYLNASSPEEIAIRYPTLTLEQVYATITYYLHNKDEIDKYLERWLRYLEESWKEQLNNPTPAVRRLKEIKFQRQLKVKFVST